MSEEAKKSEEEFSFKCPSCKTGIIHIYKSIYNTTDGDSLLILKFECTSCNYSKNDIIPLETKMKSGISTLRVENEEDLKSKIYRSMTGKLEIPELELLVNPGPSAKFYYTNVEGILERFLTAVRILHRDLEENDPQIEEVEEILKDLENAKIGKFPFTLKITDSQGGSYIIPIDKSKYTFEKMDPTKE